MHEVAALDLACSIGGLTTKELSSRDSGTYTSQSFEISGCGKTEIFLIQQYAVGPNDRWMIFSDKQIRTSLEFTLGKECSTWTVEFIDDLTRGVTACGQKTVYVLGSNGWTANP